MIRIECEEPVKEVCDCCGGTTIRLTRFVYENGDAFATYYGLFSDNHPAREVKLAVSLGGWGEGSSPKDRRSFALVLGDNESEYQVKIVDAEESPWQGVGVIGQMLDRDEALTHPWLNDVFHITDHIVTDDAEIKTYFEGESASGI
ncbi:MAG: hypothetical protein ACRD2L_14935 [Terriglobia bacterium]